MRTNGLELINESTATATATTTLTITTNAAKAPTTAALTSCC